ncbi:hypothetical protein [Streptomyces bambusae]|uniref:CSLREA domain-containing protein n=1 Tax=Streptomyces bambusae TaxID=1550616 RepID=A0ABS6Z123_9ACTN|nr:hypothetical protein [Streptomyces bambusae]MBW5481451.1 hypothetical protein [Streptomyces bambusae]
MFWQSARVVRLRLPYLRRIPALAGLAAGAAMALPAPLAHADTVSVPCSVSALRAAIITANSQPDPDTLRLDPACTYRLAMPDTNSPAHGLPAITSNITIDGRGATITRDSSAPAFRILFVDTTGTLTLNHTTISGGRATTLDCPLFPGEGTCGGGIVNAGTMTVNHSRVINNTATSDVFAQGGGIDNEGTGTVNDTEVSGNTAEYTGTGTPFAAAGGGIVNDGPLTVDRSRVHHNAVRATADTGSQVEAAGLAAFASTSIKHTVISDNHASSPGGLTRGALVNNARPPAIMTVTDTVIRDNTNSSPHGLATAGGATTNRTMILTRTRIIGNHATAPDGGTARGGGLSLGPTGRVTLNSSTVQGNRASAPGGGIARGGGVSNPLGGTLTIEQSHISQNTVTAPEGGTAQGGGLFNDVGSTTLTRSTVIRNSAGDGGGIFEASGTVTLNGTEVRANRPNNCAPPGSVPGCTG